MMLIMFDIMPIIMIGCTLMVMISFMVKEKVKLKKVLFSIGATIATIYMFILFAIAVPYTFLSSILDNFVGLGLMLVIIFAVWTVVSLFIQFRNQYSFYINKTKDIYIRDIEVKYSPAVASYLMNNRIETTKDLSATLLNLCAKNILKIERKENKIDIIDLDNRKEVAKLCNDEKYAYQMLVEGVDNKKINMWKKKVYDEYQKYGFSKNTDKPLGMYIFGVYVAIFIMIFIYMIFTGEYTITGKIAEVLGYILITTFIAAWEMIVLSGFKHFFNTILNKNNSNEFRDIYTSKGAREYTKWKRFQDFMEDFSLIDEKEHESVVLWGKYLSYSIALGINKKCDKELYDRIEKEYYFNYNVFSNIYEELRV